MGRRTLRLAADAMAAGVVLVGAGCTANAPGGHASPASAVSQPMPVPFIVKARYTGHLAWVAARSPQPAPWPREASGW